VLGADSLSVGGCGLFVGVGELSLGESDGVVGDSEVGASGAALKQAGLGETGVGCPSSFLGDGDRLTGRFHKVVVRPAGLVSGGELVLRCGDGLLELAACRFGSFEGFGGVGELVGGGAAEAGEPVGEFRIMELVPACPPSASRSTNATRSPSEAA
jgi:hypothetical protein